MSARGLRIAHPDDWYFQGHFPGDPVVPAIVLIELLAQTGGLAAASDERRATPMLRLAALGPFKFPSAARPNQPLEARARVVRRIGTLVRVAGEGLAGGGEVATGSGRLADVEPRR